MNDELQKLIDQTDERLVKLASEARKERNVGMEIQILRILVDTRRIIAKLQKD